MHPACPVFVSCHVCSREKFQYPGNDSHIIGQLGSEILVRMDVDVV